MEVFEHPGDPLFWFWFRVASLALYVLIAARLLCRPGWSSYLQETAREVMQDLNLHGRTKHFSSVAPHVPSASVEAVDDVEPVERGQSLWQCDVQGEIAFDVLTQAIGPYCCTTVACSLVRNFSEEDPTQTQLSFMYGDINLFTLFLVSILWILQLRPNQRWRMIIWALLALWYSSTSVVAFVDPGLKFYEDIWLNHMVFLAVVSLGLGLPRPWVWLLTFGHSMFFLVVTLAAPGHEKQYKPAIGMQIVLVTIMAVFTKYSQVVVHINRSQAEVERELQRARLMALKREEEAKLAEERANLAEAEARLARAEHDARMALMKADLAEQDRRAIEERAQLVECTKGAFQHLLDMLCDAFVELDGTLKLTNPGKLGTLLSQVGSSGLQGRQFKDLVVESDRGRFEAFMQKEEHAFPFQVTLQGAYNAKIKVIMYLTGVHHQGEKIYLIGINEAEEQELSEVKHSGSCFSNNSANLMDGVLATRSTDDEEDVRRAASWAWDQTAQSLRKGLGPPRIVPMEAEEQMQSLLALIWTWPIQSTPSPTCCETHQQLAIASERVETLRSSLSCTAVPRCLAWQCPSCHTLGFPEECRGFNQDELHCVKCQNWEMLF
ncbi:Uncharacterized protein SCF082_LOCUS39117 [Durusdinium trenchii]|uniref:Uncharacterized protein n=1 Tax=Durusdinium trenchii TaxID=1381693 RepID=A0ABP0Q208_9DINO